jgi:hypothetical protein
MRLSLEGVLLLALQDAGMSHLPDDQTLNAKRAIDRLLHSRSTLEIDRACAAGDWISAVELRRRQVLWHGSGSADEVRRDVFRMVLPAAARCIAQTYAGLSDVRGLCLKGFSGPWLKEFLAQWYPQIPLLAADDDGNALIVHRDEPALAEDQAGSAGDALAFARLVRLYRVARETVDLNGL